MTTEKAIKWMQSEQRRIDLEYDTKENYECYEAFNMAIAALKNKNVLIDKVLEIIDKVSHKTSAGGGFWTAERVIMVLRRDIKALKGGEQ